MCMGGMGGGRSGELGRVAASNESAPACTACGYPLAGAPELKVVNKETWFRCPECGLEGPMHPKRLPLAVRWIGWSLLACVVFLGLFVLMTLAAMGIGHTGSNPFRIEIANSDLVMYGRGGVGAGVDLTRWTPEVETDLFRASGGWLAAFGLTTLISLLVVALVWLGLLGIAGRFSRAGRSWFVMAPLIPAVLLAASAGFLECAGTSASSSVRGYATTLATCHVGTIVSMVAGLAQGLGVIWGMLLGRKWHAIAMRRR